MLVFTQNPKTLLVKTCGFVALHKAKGNSSFPLTYSIFLSQLFGKSLFSV